MEPLVIVASLFSMSLLAAILLFKWLKNTAIVTLPFGRFGGAIAGFIGVFLVLQNSYANFSQKENPPLIEPPPGYSTFISQIDGIGGAYPNNLKLDNSIQLRMIGVLKIGDNNENIIIGLQPFSADLLEGKSKEASRRDIIESNFAPIKLIGADLIESHSFSVNGILGERRKYSFKFGENEMRSSQVAIPHFENKALYVFNLTSSPESFEKDQIIFEQLLSTIRFFK